jgi:hypothetical protein
MNIPQLYIDGFVIETFDSRDTHGHSDDDYYLSHLVVQAIEEGGIWKLIAYRQAETCGAEDPEDDYVESGDRLYELPFPTTPKLRIAMLRLFLSQAI